MTYGCEVMILVDIGMPSCRIQYYYEQSNDAGLEGNLNLLEERRQDVDIRAATYIRRMEQHFNKMVKQRLFKVRDLVLREVGMMPKRQEENKLRPDWEGPYLVIANERLGSYQLEDLKEKEQNKAVVTLEHRAFNEVFCLRVDPHPSQIIKSQFCKPQTPFFCDCEIMQL